MKEKQMLCPRCKRVMGEPGSKCRDHVAPAGNRVFVALDKPGDE